MKTLKTRPNIAIACGGTGGHLFPGLAVGQKLLERDCAVTLLISPKDVDQQGVKAASGMEILTLPAVGLQRGSRLAFLRGMGRSYRVAKACFKARRPQAVLAMGGFTSAPPILAGKRLGARTFLHESNTIPGRANRLLSRIVDRAFIAFPSAEAQLRRALVSVTGTPVRQSLKSQNAVACRRALGLDPERQVILVTGGSQGASGLNEMVMKALPLMAQLAPEVQWFHLAGSHDAGLVRSAYAAAGLGAVVHDFFGPMDLALGAATAAISRAGASSLAELAAMNLPAILIPFPDATDNHQLHNAKAFADTGAALLLDQRLSTPYTIVQSLLELTRNNSARERMQKALAQWQTPDAADRIADAILSTVPHPVRATTESEHATHATAAARTAIQEGATA